MSQNAACPRPMRTPITLRYGLRFGSERTSDRISEADSHVYNGRTDGRRNPRLDIHRAAFVTREHAANRAIG